jgi:hypothetical protein
MAWGPFDGGSTIGTTGSEGGIILRDEEHSLGSRITLERDGTTAPYAVTCGIYGSMFHTAWAGSEAAGAAMYEAMRDRLAQLLEAPSEEEYLAMLRRFVDDF